MPEAMKVEYLQAVKLPPVWQLRLVARHAVHFCLYR
jgi:hypothetical protein